MFFPKNIDSGALYTVGLNPSFFYKKNVLAYLGCDLDEVIDSYERANAFLQYNA